MAVSGQRNRATVQKRDNEGRLSAAPAPARRLYLLALSLVEVANLVEVYKRREAVEAFDPLRYIPRC